jgi:NAD(P)-dependent dehydrogenase (short-subunit alcohol dehydrogenase family)
LCVQPSPPDSLQPAPAPSPVIATSDADEFAATVRPAGRCAAKLPRDVCDERHCVHMVGRAITKFGHPEILVNNAGYQMSHEDIEGFTTKEFDRAFKTTVYAMFWLCRAALARMRPESTIINTVSIQAFDPSPNLLPYVATKGAIINFTKGLSQIAMKKGIR